MIDARDRLIPPDQLLQVAALLNVLRMDDAMACQDAPPETDSAAASPTWSVRRRAHQPVYQAPADRWKGVDLSAGPAETVALVMLGRYV
ncbi:hypothetical protein FHU36_007490 [Nonomuraea muscovyensis]|uniref:Uncharacterized protein n=1 Tax=Nonomuraea muscovyensis TaxID=1124761 RepID=A0A7X0CA65_9ACTN|nr:hypothetical protein [Nonomuraea muscovyensis]MBB6350918.1 hypothetical protein [Nonomuraea muscovyensis]